MWELCPGVAYYFAKIVGRAYPFVGLESSFSWTFSHATFLAVPDVRSTVRSIGVRPSAGLVFMLVSHVGIEGELNLLRSWTNLDQDTFLGSAQPNTTAYGFTAGVTAFVF